MRKNILSIIVFAFTLTSHAQDRYFARTYTSNVLAKGAFDLEFWHTSRIGRANQFYHGQDQRMEVELGLGNNLQTAFYFNRFQQRFSEDSNGTSVSNEIGFSNEWKWRFKPGFALYGEWGLKGGDELELEVKFIADKNIGKSLIAFNAIAEYEKEFEWENGKLESPKGEVKLEFDLAYLYNFSRSWGIGIELRNKEFTQLSGGPTVTYWGDRFFITGNYLPQLIRTAKTERVEARILLGISL